MDKTKDRVAKRTSPLRYAVGMFGTSIPVNMFKIYAAFFMDHLGFIPTPQYSLILLVYTFLTPSTIRSTASSRTGHAQNGDAGVPTSS